VFKGVCVFVLTYLFVAGPRWRAVPLDRAGGALLGAVLAVILGVLTPHEAIAAVNGETMLLLFGLMGVGAFLLEGGLLDRAADAVAAWAGTPQRLLAALVWGAGGLAALVTNDAVCVIFAPVVVTWIARHQLPPLPFLIALATAANTGSVATLVGNPQNMLCATLGGLAYRDYATHVVPVALIGLVVNHGLIAWLYRRELAAARLAVAVPATPAGDSVAPPAATPRRVLHGKTAITLAVIAATVVAYLAGADLAFTAVAGFVALLLFHRADPTRFWMRIDWSVLLFFGGLFVVVEALVRSGGAAWVLDRFPLFVAPAAGVATVSDYLRTAGVFLVGSNIVSNVPFILVVRDEMARLPDPRLAWELLAVASTFAGNLTLLGSVANIIVAERGRVVGGLPFFAYLRVGLPLALLTTATGTGWLLWVHGVRW
jgi:Na+/H+ antiporter NhaD/arsenite permease-like protein